MSGTSLFASAILLFCPPQDHNARPGSGQTLGSTPAPRAAAPAGLTTSDWSSIRDAYEANRHKFFAIENGWQARNPGQRWITFIDERGFTIKPEGGGWSWGLDLQSYGWGKTHPVTASRATTTNGGRLSREWDTRVTEWYVNDPRGLEHGLTIASRPSRTCDPLTLEFEIRGGLRPVVSQDGRHVSFASKQSGAALSYNGLTVLDAEGNKVSARWHNIGGTQLRLQVDDAMVQYPLTIDPVAQQAYLKASNTDASDGFGNGVAISGNTVVVGAPFEDSNASGVNGNQADNSASNSGAAYVFVRDGSNWSQQAYLKRSPSALSGTYFGATVAISGDTIVVGAWNEGSGSGSIHVFFRTGTTWIQQASLKASNQQSADRFGKSIAISGDTIVAGAYNEDSDATGVDGNQANNNAWHAGAAYVFVRSASTWTQQAYLKASNTDAADEFGFSVGISNDTIVVGARFEHSSATGVNGNQSDNIATNSGAAYVFVRSGSTWTQQAYLKASNTDLHDNFGSSIAISGETIVVGAPSEDSNATGINGNQANNSAVGSGAAYVFVRSGGIWSQQAYLKASNTGNSDGFGVSVAISSEIVAVGAWQEDSSATGVNGDQLNNSASNSGAAYIFERDGTSWTQTAYLKASQTGADDLFGTLVAISGGLVVIGAIGEDSSATGVNGNQANNSAASSGAVYIFDLDDNAGTASYGTGTSGCAGTHTLGVTHAPMINSPHFGITCNNAPPSSLGLGILANAQDSAGSDPFGIGALLHVDLFASTEVITLDFFSDAQGNGLAAAPIPNAPTLVGNTYYAMALWAWTTCSLPPFNLSSSQGLSMTVLVP